MARLQAVHFVDLHRYLGGEIDHDSILATAVGPDYPLTAMHPHPQGENLVITSIHHSWQPLVSSVMANADVPVAACAEVPANHTGAHNAMCVLRDVRCAA